MKLNLLPSVLVSSVLLATAAGAVQAAVYEETATGKTLEEAERRCRVQAVRKTMLSMVPLEDAKRNAAAVGERLLKNASGMVSVKELERGEENSRVVLRAKVTVDDGKVRNALLGIPGLAGCVKPLATAGKPVAEPEREGKQKKEEEKQGNAGQEKSGAAMQDPDGGVGPFARMEYEEAIKEWMEQTEGDQTEAVAFLKRLAAKGNVLAAGALRSIGIEKFDAPASWWQDLLALADGDSADAGTASWLASSIWSLELGPNVIYGLAERESKRLLERAIERGCLDAMAAKALMLLKRDKWDEGRSLLEKAAAGGHPIAVHALGLAYETGRGWPRDMKKAADMHRRASSAGNGFLPSLHRLALLLADGKGVPRDRIKARELLEKAAARGHVQAMMDAGALCRADGNAYAAASWFRAAAEAGRADALYELAVSDGTEEKEVARLLEEAAGKGVARAQRELGRRLLLGVGGMQKNPSRGLNLLYDAADRHDAEAKGLLGQHYLLETAGADGRDLNAVDRMKNWKTAYAKLKEAADAGDLESQYVLGCLLAGGGSVHERFISSRGAGSADAGRFFEGLRRLEQAAARGHARAQFMAGWLYRFDPALRNSGAKTAAGYLRSAAAAGVVPAKVLLAQMLLGALKSSDVLTMLNHLYNDGVFETGSVPADPAEIEALLGEAAKAGNPRAQYDLAVLYREGLVLKKDLQRADALFRSAAKQGMRAALESLGRMHGDGKYGMEDRAFARECWLKAAAMNSGLAKQRLQEMGGLAPALPGYLFDEEALRKQAESGDMEAQYAYGCFLSWKRRYASGTGGDWMQKAATGGHYIAGLMLRLLDFQKSSLLLTQADPFVLEKEFELLEPNLLKRGKEGEGFQDVPYYLGALYEAKRGAFFRKDASWTQYLYESSAALNCPGAHVRLFSLCAKEGRHADADRHLEAASGAALYAAAVLASRRAWNCKDKGDVQKALDSLDALIRRGCPYAAVLLGRWHAEHGNLEEARRLLSDAAKEISFARNDLEKLRKEQEKKSEKGKPGGGR